MIGWLLNLIYAGLLVVVSPMLVWRMIVPGKYRDGWSEKFAGRLPVSAEDESVVWLHAVSVGEVLQLRTIVARLRETYPSHTILITTTTVTGRAVAVETFPDCRIAYAPLDFTWAVRNALRRVQPVLIGLVELELWPNLIREASAAGIPLMLINGRISQRSYRGYRRVRPLMRSLLRRMQQITVQTDEYAQRLVDLGAPADRVHVTGSIKFDGVSTNSLAEQTNELRTAFGIDPSQPILIAGSTHDPEEAHALDTWLVLKREIDDLQLILVPRHRERFEDVAALVESRGLSVRRRTRTETLPPSDVDSVCLLDSLGELSACWGLADVAFVGGSLTRRGGQNMIEPAALGVPVIVGPNTSNFRDVVEGLLSVAGIRVIGSAAELPDAVRTLLDDPITASRMAHAAHNFVQAQQGATERTLALLLEILDARHSFATRRAA